MTLPDRDRRDQSLERTLARRAHALHLDALNVHDAPEDDLRAFAVTVLEALAARGLVRGPDELACYAREGTPGH